MPSNNKAYEANRYAQKMAVIKPNEGDNMLREFLRIKTAQDKPNYLARFNPSYLMFRKDKENE